MQALVSDALWERLKPLLPPPPTRRFRFPGRKPLHYRKILTGILFVLKTGVAWANLPRSLGCGCGKTCRHYLELWYQAGIWQQLYAALRAELQDAEQIDWERAQSDAVLAKAPDEDAELKSKERSSSDSHHDLLTAAATVSQSVTMTVANVSAVAQCLQIRTEIPQVGDQQRQQPEQPQAERGHDSAALQVAALAADHAGAGPTPAEQRQWARSVPLLRGADALASPRLPLADPYFDLLVVPGASAATSPSPLAQAEHPAATRTGDSYHCAPFPGACAST